GNRRDAVGGRVLQGAIGEWEGAFTEVINDLVTRQVFECGRQPRCTVGRVRRQGGVHWVAPISPDIIVRGGEPRNLDPNTRDAIAAIEFINLERQSSRAAGVSEPEITARQRCKSRVVEAGNVST